MYSVCIVFNVLFTNIPNFCIKSKEVYWQGLYKKYKSIRHRCPHFSTFVTKYLDRQMDWHAYKRTLVVYISLFPCYLKLLLPNKSVSIPKKQMEWIKFTVTYCSLHPTMPTDSAGQTDGGTRANLNAAPKSGGIKNKPHTQTNLLQRY